MEARKTTSIKEVEIPNTPWLTLKQGAAYVQVGYARFTEAASRGGMPILFTPSEHQRGGAIRKVHKADIDEWLTKEDVPKSSRNFVRNTPWCTLEEAAEYTGVSYENLLRAADAVEFPVYKPTLKANKSSIRVNKDDLNKWLQADFEAGIDRNIYVYPSGESWQGSEDKLRDKLQSAFVSRGYTAQTEQTMLCGGRSDILVRNDGELFAIVEVKVTSPLKGVGQLLAYAYGLEPVPHLILVVDSHACNGMEAHACNSAGIEMWIADGHRLDTHPLSKSEILPEIREKEV